MDLTGLSVSSIRIKVRTKSSVIKLGNIALLIGFTPKRFAIGISIDRYELDIDFIFFWLVVTRLDG